MASADDKAPTGLVPRSERKPAFDAKAAVIPVVAIVFASIVLVFALGLVALQSGNSYEIGRQRDLLGNAFRAAAEQVGWELTPQVYWQDAFERVTADDTDWMTNNQNAYLYSLFGYSRIYVLDADDKPISAFEDGAEADPGAFAAVAPSLIGPVSEIRTLGGDPAPAVGRIVQEKTAQDGTQLRLVIVGQIESVAGVPSIVVAATIVPDLDASTFTGNPPLLIAVESLDDAFIARMSREFAFAGLTWGPPPSSGWASYTLTSSTGAPVGTLSWIPDRPGTAFVHEITPALVIALLVLFLVATTAVLGTRRFVAAESGSRAKSAFLATMSHEIRTPLNGIAGMIDLLDGPDLNADQHTKLATIRQCSDTLLELINDVLDFSKLEADMIELDLREFDLADAVDAVMGIAATRARAKSLGFVATHPLRKVKTDATRLRQILLNLVGNAVKFTEAGDVRVEVSEMPTRNGVEWLRFAVIDSGIGIAPDRRHRLFQEFSQVDETITRRFGGSGLGLAICAKLTGAMGGKIGVDSEPGKGSTFWFTLPVGGADLSPRLEPIPKRVVLATPSHAVNEQVTTMLVRAGHTVALHPSELSAVDMMLVDIRSLQDGSIALNDDDLKHTLVFGFGAGAHSATAWRAIDGPLTSRRIADALAGKSWDRRARPRNSGPRVGRVLLVEDNRINQEVAAGLLRRMGLTVEIAGDGQQAVDRVAKGELDLVLMDMQMPVMDGLEATRRIRAANGPLVAVPIIGLTANAFVSDKQACLDAGMDGFMPKPINRRKLESIVDQWLPYQAPGEVAGTTTAAAAPVAEQVAPSESQAAAPADLVDDHQQAALRAEIGQDILDSLVTGFWTDADTIMTELKAGGASSEAIGRALHTLKGTAQTLGLAAIARTTAAAEEAFRASGQFDMASIEQAVNRTHAALAVASQPPSDATGKQQGQAA